MLEYVDSTTEAELRALARELHDTMKKGGFRRGTFGLDKYPSGWVFRFRGREQNKPLPAFKMKQWLLKRIRGEKRAQKARAARVKARIRVVETLIEHIDRVLLSTRTNSPYQETEKSPDPFGPGQ